MAASGKLVALDLPNEMIVFFRNLFGMLYVLPWILLHDRDCLRSGRLRFHGLRALVGLTAMYGFFYAVARLPLAEAFIFFLTSPFYIPIIAYIWLGERAPRRVIAAIALGFIGVAIVLRPGLHEWSWVALVALGSALFTAGVKVIVRQLSFSEPLPRVVFCFAAVGTVVSAIPAALHWVTPSWQAWVLLLSLSAVGTFGQLLMSYAHALAPAATLGPMVYSAVVFSAGYGWLLWRDPIDSYTLWGGGLIILAGLLASSRQRKYPLVETD
jgi:drug/metabolite transporter (DMT)-like permease